jgi:putative GTP pyrophosphokinase
VKDLSLPDQNELRQVYNQYSENRALVIKDLEIRIEGMISAFHPIVKGRAKDFDSFFKKYIRLLQNSPPGSGAPPITDLIGIRIVCPFIEDLSGVEDLIKKNFEVIEVERRAPNIPLRNSVMNPPIFS